MTVRFIYGQSYMGCIEIYCSENIYCIEKKRSADTANLLKCPREKKVTGNDGQRAQQRHRQCRAATGLHAAAWQEDIHDLLTLYTYTFPVVTNRFTGKSGLSPAGSSRKPSAVGSVRRVVRPRLQWKKVLALLACCLLACCAPAR
jgi:hypothetical protein